MKNSSLTYELPKPSPRPPLKLGASLELGAWEFGGSPFIAPFLRPKIPNQAYSRCSKVNQGNPSLFQEKKDCLFL
jgi:hypothetical protein